ncbi:MAG: ATP-grasp domain-containing protein [Betaproteobacteria bacterium]|nr:ATP-grasp domain-containing protein [Betaproteobacteria bacterium]
MMAEPRLTIAVTGMNALPENPGPGLAVARCLREAYGPRIRLVGLGYDALDPGLYLSEYCDSAHMLGYPSEGSEVLLERLAGIHADKHIDLLIPCLDSELPQMVSTAPRLAAMGIRTFLPDAQALARRSKDRLSELCEAAGVACPEIKPVTSANFFRTCQADGWSFPMVVKGPFYDARIVRSAEEGAAAFRSIAAEWGLPVLAQRFVAGEEYNLTGVADNNGILLGEVMMKKRALTAKGKAWAGIAIFDENLADAARRLVAALHWKGPLEVEMMRDAGGSYHLIEINPRFPSWIYLSQGVGRNLPALLTELALGRPAPALPAPRPGTMFIRYALETIVPLCDFETMMMDGCLARRLETQGVR